MNRWNWKQLFNCLLAVWMLSIMSLPTAFADDTGTSTISNVHGGSWSMVGSLSGTPTNGGPNQNVTLEVGKTYQFTAWIRGVGMIALVLQKGDWSSSVVYQKFTASADWQQFTVTYTVPATGAGVYHAQIQDVYQGNSPATVYIDDVFFGEASGSNLLVNGDFELGNNNTAWSGVKSPFAIVNQDPNYVDGFVDPLNNYNYIYQKSSNIGMDTTSPGNVGGDTSRLTKSSSADGYFIYKTNYDIKSFSISSYYWSNVAVTDLNAYASVDGQNYTELTLEKHTFTASSWTPIVYESYNLPAGSTYLKIVIPYNGSDANPWATQISSVTINRNTAPVDATPGPAKISGPTDVTLSTRTEGAQIYYSTATVPKTLYTGPIHLTGSTKITAYAQKSGMSNSIALTYVYSSNADEIVDPYGQMKNIDFTGKVKSDDELKADLGADQAYYGSLTPPQRDEYGGLPNSKGTFGLQATGYFHTQTLANGKVVLVDPIGNLYFSLGVNGVGAVGDTYTQVSGRQEIYQWLPPFEKGSTFETAYLDPNGNNFSFYLANKIKKTGLPFDAASFYKESVDRLRKWGFTSEGGFSPTPSGSLNDTNFSQVRFINLPSGDMMSGVNLFDIYKSSAAADIDTAFQRLTARANDPLLIGYFIGNEFEYHKLKGTISTKKASEVASKKALVDMLIDKYGSNIGAFNTAWGLNYGSFDSLYEASFSVKTDAASKDMDEFTKQYMDKLYSTAAAAFRKYDPHHMLLGDRYLTAPMNDDKLRGIITEAAGKYVDALSYNYYTYDLDMNRIKSMFEQSGGKPLLFTEFHYGEPTEGLTFGVRMADNEHEKGLMYRNYVEKAAASGYVIGAHWFEYLDQAATGRWFQGYNGESGAIGLVNVADRPYKDFLNSVMETNYHIYDIVNGSKQPYSYPFGPGQGERNANKVLQIPKALSPITVDGTLDTAWPAGGEASLTDMDRILGTSKSGVSANMRLAWDESNLYVYAHMKDPTPMMNAFTGSGVWNGDAVELFIGPQNIDQGGAIQPKDSQLILSGGLSNGAVQYYWYNNAPQNPVQMAVKKDDDGQGYVVEAAIPMSGLNISDAAVGKTIRFDIGFDDGSGSKRERQYLWNGVDGNAQNRDKWGRAVFVQSIDTTPPVTTASLAPAQPDGLNGWYVHPVTVSLQAADDQTGVAGTVYSVDSGTSWQSYTAPLTFDHDGVYTVAYRSTDNAGNAETVKTAGFKLDSTAPVITINGLTNGSYSDAEEIAPTIVLSDDGAGIDGSRTSIALDAVPYQSGVTIPLYTLPLGEHVLTVSSADLAGNTSAATVKFDTYASIDSLKALVRRFADMMKIDHAGITNSLQQKLEHGDIGAFMNEVQAQSGKHIAEDAARYLLRDAQAVIRE